MRNATESEARAAWRELLGEYLGALCEPVLAEGPAAGEAWDDVITCSGPRFLIDYRPRADAASVAAAVEDLLSRRKNLPEDMHPLLVVPLMNATGCAICEREDVDWMDLAGNAYITSLPRIRIIIEGKKPAARPRGRKNSVFATKSSRLAHWLLLHQGRAHTHGQLTEATGLDKGQLSRILSRMLDLRLIQRQDNGYILTRPSTLLEAWREAYQPPCKSILKGVIPSRSGEETVRIIEDGLRTAKRKYVLGGLASAYGWGACTDFHIATFYLDATASPQLLNKIGFAETNRGANVWFMQEADDVAFLGSAKSGKSNLASPWFTSVDLAAHPEGSKDAADHLRRHVLKLEVE